MRHESRNHDWNITTGVCPQNDAKASCMWFSPSDFLKMLDEIRDDQRPTAHRCLGHIFPNFSVGGEGATQAMQLLVVVLLQLLTFQVVEGVNPGGKHPKSATFLGENITQMLGPTSSIASDVRKCSMFGPKNVGTVPMFNINKQKIQDGVFKEVLRWNPTGCWI